MFTIMKQPSKNSVKFNNLIQKIKTYEQISLDLTDFGINNDQVDDLVEAINVSKKIKILIIKHNALGDDAADKLGKLINIAVLDISHNDFTDKGIDKITEQFRTNGLSVDLLSEFNNTSSKAQTRH